MTTTQPTSQPAAATYDVERIRADFPILSRKVYDKPLVYLDNAATTQKPRGVIDCLSAYYERLNANVHRGVHYLSEAATDSYEEARRRVQRFLGAADSNEIVFVRGGTEAINLVAHSWGTDNLLKNIELGGTELPGRGVFSFMVKFVCPLAVGVVLAFIIVTGQYF